MRITRHYDVIKARAIELLKAGEINNEHGADRVYSWDNCCCRLRDRKWKLKITSRSQTCELWGFACLQCDCWHWHRPGEGFRKHVCHSREGAAAFKLGYYVRQSPDPLQSAIHRAGEVEQPMPTAPSPSLPSPDPDPQPASSPPLSPTSSSTRHQIRARAR